MSNTENFLIGEKSSIDRLNMKAMVHKWVVQKDAHLLTKKSYRLEGLHRFGGCIGILSYFGAKIQIKLTNHDIG